MTVKTPQPPPLPDQLERLLRRLRMPYVRHAAPEVLATAMSQRWEPAEVLRVLLAEEAAGRDQATIRMRRRQSGLPAGKTFDAWDERASPIPKATQQVLRSLEWIARAENLCILRARHRQEPSRRGARAPGHRPRQDRRLAHPRVAGDPAASPPRR